MCYSRAISSTCAAETQAWARRHDKDYLADEIQLMSSEHNISFQVSVYVRLETIIKQSAPLGCLYGTWASDIMNGCSLSVTRNVQDKWDYGQHSLISSSGECWYIPLRGTLN